MIKRCIGSVLLFTAFFLPAAAAASQPGGDDDSIYEIHPALAGKVETLIETGAKPRKALESIDEALMQAVLKGEYDEIRELFILKGAATLFYRAQDRETALLIFRNPGWCSRFLHNFDEDDLLDGALRVIRVLYDNDPEAFADKFEFCLAYAVVWDKFAGHHWVQAPIEEETMLNTYRSYLDKDRKMRIMPGKLPCELNVFIVGSRLSKAERDWVYKNYNSRGLDAKAIYSSIPWTLNNKVSISPAHGKGLDLPYVLETIKKIGGCCMEQAYFTENIFRLFGVPAIYTSGRGSKSGAGHAWAGVLEDGARKSLEWNFSVGRYQSHHYYKGEVSDPTNTAERLTDSEVKILGAMLKAKNPVEGIEKSSFYLDAAIWADKNMLAWTDDGRSGVNKEDLLRELLEKSMKAARFNPRTWRYLSLLASKKKMDEKRAAYWIDRAVRYTIEEYPDFTVDILYGFLGCIEDPGRKLHIVQDIYKKLEEPRPDLACDIKIMEGDFWMTRDELHKALKCYISPFTSFSEDRHVLDAAKEKLGTIETLISDKKELIRAYELVIAATKNKRRKSRTMAEVVSIAAGKLVELYTQTGEISKAKRYKRYVLEE